MERELSDLRTWLGRRSQARRLLCPAAPPLPQVANQALALLHLARRSTDCPRPQVHALDALARWGNISSQRLDGYFRALVSEGMLRPTAGEVDTYDVNCAKQRQDGGAGGLGALCAKTADQGVGRAAAAAAGPGASATLAAAGRAVAQVAAATERELGRAMADLNVGGQAGSGASRPPKAVAKAVVLQSSEQGGVWSGVGSEVTQSMLAPADQHGLMGASGQEDSQPPAPLHFEVGRVHRHASALESHAVVLFPATCPCSSRQSTQPSQAGAPGRARKLSMVEKVIRQTCKRRRAPTAADAGGGECSRAAAVAQGAEGGAAAGSRAGRTRTRARRN